MAQQDQFADLLSSFSSGKKNNLNKLSLAERQRQNLSTPTGATSLAHSNNSWSGLDLLGTQKAASSKSNAPNGSNADDFDFFNNMSSSSVNLTDDARLQDNSIKNTSASASVSTHANNNWDDIFRDHDSPSPLPPAQPMSANNSGKNFFEDDEFTDAFQADNDSSIPTSNHQAPHLEQPKPELPRRQTKTVPAPTESEMYKRDEALSELMEMGFDFNVAKNALRKTKDFDINEAISIIMNEAHSKSSANSKQQHARPQSEAEDISLMMQGITVDLKSKAFNLLSKGRQTLAKGVEMYREQQFQTNDNQPAWMRNQATYKQNSTPIKGQEDDDDEEFDQEQMRKIVEQQRAYNKQLREEKERREKEKRRASSAGSNRSSDPPQRQQYQQAPAQPPRPPPSRRDQLSSSNVSRRSTTSKFDEPIARRPRPQRGPSAQSQQQLQAQAPAPKTRPQVSVDLFSPEVKKKSSPVVSAPEEMLIDTSATSGTSATSSSSLVPHISMSSFQSDSFEDSRSQGNDFFKKGDFSSALLKYQDSLMSLPAGHKLRVIALSNISNAQLKLGSTKECLASIEEALQLIASWNLQKGQYADVELDKNKFLKPIWLKMIGRKAESLEHLEKFKDALDNYNICIENGGSTKMVLDGKNRVMKVLAPKSATPKPTSAPVSKPQTPAKTTHTTSAAASGPNLRNLQAQNQVKAKEDQQRFELHDSIEQKVISWRMGKEDNLRALLSSLHEILWPEAGWKPVGMTDLVLNKKVKIYYLKAVAKTHPDKLNSATSVEQKMIAQNVFVTLNQSWDKFKEANGMS